MTVRRFAALLLTLGLLSSAHTSHAYEDRCVLVDESGKEHSLPGGCSYSAVEAASYLLTNILFDISKAGATGLEEVEKKYFYHPDLPPVDYVPGARQKLLKEELSDAEFFKKGKVLGVEQKGDVYYKNPHIKDFEAQVIAVFQVHVKYISDDEDIWTVEMGLEGNAVKERRLYSDTGGYYPQYDYKISSIKIASHKK